MGYPERLWCIWELYTVHSFAKEEQAAKRIHFVPFGNDGGERAIKKFLTFRVCDAHCYDPNEERKLLKIIEAAGEDRFNSKIRRMAADVEKGGNFPIHSFERST